MADGNETVVYFSEQVIVLCSCALSFLGSSLIILTYIIWADLRTTPRRLLVFLSVSDWLSAVSYAYGVWRVFRTDSLDCIAQGAVSTFANTSSFFWTVATAVYLYVFIVRSNQRAADSLVWCFHIVSWGVPLAITVAAVCLYKIGYDASEVSVGWCWVRIHAPDRILWMLLTGKIWEFLAYLTLPVLYILIKRHIHIAHAALSEYRPILATRPPSQSFSSMADMKLTLIPIIFIVLRIWSTVRFILLLVDSPARQHPVLVTLHGIGNTSQGAANCIMFVLLTRPLRTRLCAALFCCSKCRADSQDAAQRLLPGQDASTPREEDRSSRVGTDG
ncbi:G-protein coupled receptor 157 isoform X1 [Pseudochaenichthys georgianus]|uniref:G-protein coupled receptor 157 isoform X1 n=1 Tax=Pseudochaenichthys georgianus TaxID=52239 RepID=UPI00146D1FE1|nr:G-protein coupled receptor 157 isoform X1 [Pseudochaenichthys georgianus]XP_033942231.1 G-protein coupled receptor 157 isoform X1 [Pseudochaenichthys georgianus]